MGSSEISVPKAHCEKVATLWPLRQWNMSLECRSSSESIDSSRYSPENIRRFAASFKIVCQNNHALVNSLNALIN